MKKILLVILITLLCGTQAFAQVDRREVRAGNRAFKKEQWQKAEIDYKKALLKDSTSVAAQYNLANDLYREENYTEAEKYAKQVSKNQGSSVVRQKKDGKIQKKH